MEFLDEDARPRFVLQSRPLSSNPQALDNPDDDHNSKKLSKPFLFLILSLSSTLLVLSLFFLHSEPWKSLLLWLSVSLLLGPFAPLSLTGGDVRVGQGPAVDFSADEDSSPAPSQPDGESKRRSKPQRRSEQFEVSSSPVVMAETLGVRAREKQEVKEEAWEEREWREDEIEVLKKQLAKNPVGKPKRWEAIADSFRGRHGLESVIKKAKELGEKKLSDGDSYSEFLRKRKPVDKRFVDQENELGSEDNNGSNTVWSSGEDIALLNALKEFPKEAPLRWEKVAATVPGKSKAACIKRVAELKKDFRSSKKAATAAPLAAES